MEQTAGVTRGSGTGWSCLIEQHVDRAHLAAAASLLRLLVGDSTVSSTLGTSGSLPDMLQSVAGSDRVRVRAQRVLGWTKQGSAQMGRANNEQTLLGGLFQECRMPEC